MAQPPTERRQENDSRDDDKHQSLLAVPGDLETVSSTKDGIDSHPKLIEARDVSEERGRHSAALTNDR